MQPSTLVQNTTSSRLVRRPYTQFQYFEGHLTRRDRQEFTARTVLSKPQRFGKGSAAPSTNWFPWLLLGAATLEGSKAVSSEPDTGKISAI